MVLIIFCHPDPRKKSHSHKILKHVGKALKSRRRKYEVLDLYKKDFECVFTENEYCWMKNRIRKTEADVKKVQKKISAADTLIFIYPTWWYNMPAELKGFMDRVFVPGFAYRFFRVNKIMLFGAWLLSWIPGVRYLMQPYSVTGLLKGKKSVIFRTYGGPALGKRIFGNTHTVLENVILRFCGITDITIHELYNIDKSNIYTQEYEDQYMAKVKQICKSI